MSFINFNSSDIVITRLNVANTQFNISTSAQAAASACWVFVANSTTAGFLPKPDTSSLSTTNVSISSAFRHIANYFFGLNSYIDDSTNKSSPRRTTIRAIQIGRPLLDEGFFENTITATISATNFTLTAYDIVNRASANSALGLTGSFVSKSNTSDIVGTVFYDHGVIVLHGGSGNTGTVLTDSASGFSISAGYVPNQITLISLLGQTRNVVKRAIYFCRAFNQEYNFTTNPTARNSNGTLISALTANPTTFITTIGLYDNSGQLLAVGKINPAKRKDFSSEVLMRVILDF